MVLPASRSQTVCGPCAGGRGSGDCAVAIGVEVACAAGDGLATDSLKTGGGAWKGDALTAFATREGAAVWAGARATFCAVTAGGFSGTPTGTPIGLLSRCQSAVRFFGRRTAVIVPSPIKSTMAAAIARPFIGKG